MFHRSIFYLIQTKCSGQGYFLYNSSRVMIHVSTYPPCTVPYLFSIAIFCKHFLALLYSVFTLVNIPSPNLFNGPLPFRFSIWGQINQLGGQADVQCIDTSMYIYGKFDICNYILANLYFLNLLHCPPGQRWHLTFAGSWPLLWAYKLLLNQSQYLHLSCNVGTPPPLTT